jgi:hypothetical protein
MRLDVFRHLGRRLDAMHHHDHDALRRYARRVGVPTTGTKIDLALALVLDGHAAPQIPR